MPAASPPRAFHVMTKPIGPVCNLDCKYCFYLEKEKLYPDTSSWRMPPEVLEQYIRQYIQSQDVPEVAFAWQGGEPTLMGLDFFRQVVRLQKQYANGKTIANALQTNGTLLDDEWCRFFHEYQFLIGLSLDGPRQFHDRYRVDKKGRPTFDQVMAGLALLKKHQVQFNILCVVNRHNSRAPLEVYEFCKNQGSGFIQFIPIVERILPRPDGGQDLSEPPLLSAGGSRSLPLLAGEPVVAPWSVEPLAYGEFLCRVFDHWVRHDVGRCFVQIFDVQLGLFMGLPSSLCVFAETCGGAMAMEHNGDLYACDHFVYPRYHLGNILQQDLGDMAASAQQRQFGTDKRDALPRFCRECDVRFACNGECPKHRFLTTPDGEAGLNYLCAGYKKFLHHIAPQMRTMAGLVRSGRPAALIMQMLRDRERPTNSAPGRNDPCPCGSGRKYKKCCLPAS